MSGSLGSLLGGDAGALLNFANNLRLGPWAWNLQPASWNGVPFFVQASSDQRGRRTAVHEYPYSDSVWVEDLGLGTHRIGIRGFLVGDDVYSQRDKMIRAAETSGPGNLVHPSLGTLTVALVNFGFSERTERGRVIEVQFDFIETQTAAKATTSALATALHSIVAAIQTGLAIAHDFIGAVTTAIGAVGAVLTFASNIFESVVGLVTGFTTLIGLSAGDSSAATSAVATLPGNNGRYSIGPLAAPLSTTTPTVTSVLANLSTARAAVAVSSTATTVVVDPSLLPVSVQALTESVRAVFLNPADQIRILLNLAAYSPTITASTAPAGGAIQTIQAATVLLIQVSAIISLANATAAYQPSSYDDAIATLNSIADLMDVVILAVADAGMDETYLALQALQAAMVNDLSTRAANLPRLMVVTSRTPRPSLALAYSLYGDATRSDELIGRADPIAPLFMPISFQALTS
jgi:prophage DNA circulation protein